MGESPNSVASWVGSGRRRAPQAGAGSDRCRMVDRLRESRPLRTNETKRRFDQGRRPSNQGKQSTVTKQLVIVESPTKAKTLERYLGDGYRVAAARQHEGDRTAARRGDERDREYAPEYEFKPDSADT